MKDKAKKTCHTNEMGLKNLSDTGIERDFRLGT
jgi:hypothetical protein